MFRQFGPLEIMLILLILILLFGAKRLPDTAKSLGQSLKIFKKSVREDETEPQAKREITAGDEVVEPTRVEQPKQTDV